MKTLLTILSIVTFVTNIHASTVSTYKRGSVKLISDNSATKEKTRNAAEKKARAKAKEITGVKIEIPSGAKHHGIIIDPDKRGKGCFFISFYILFKHSNIQTFKHSNIQTLTASSRPTSLLKVSIRRAAGSIL